MTDRVTVHCWKCGYLHENLLLPFSRSQECGVCSADLHCCRGCENYSAHVADSCLEDRAESVTNKETANFCDFFSASKICFTGTDNSEAEAAKRKLAELFGDVPEPATDSNLDKGPDKGFDNGPDNNSESEADKALAELNRLFSKD